MKQMLLCSLTDIFNTAFLISQIFFPNLFIMKVLKHIEELKKQCSKYSTDFLSVCVCVQFYLYYLKVRHFTSKYFSMHLLRVRSFARITSNTISTAKRFNSNSIIPFISQFYVQISPIVPRISCINSRFMCCFGLYDSFFFLNLFLLRYH